MAVVAARTVSLSLRRNVFNTAIKLASMPDPIEHATGLEKRELLAKAAGIENPFDMKVFKRGPGTKDCPNQVPSAFESRLMGCICNEECTYVNWMWIHQGEPRRCLCGHWFELVYKAPV